MVGLTLLAEARAAGLDVEAGADGRLIVRGPRSAEAIARRLLAHKADVMALLRPDAGQPDRRADLAAGEFQCPRCAATRFVDVVLNHPPHDGRSTRRDCAQCRATWDFVKWHTTPSDN